MKHTHLVIGTTLLICVACAFSSVRTAPVAVDEPLALGTQATETRNEQRVIPTEDAVAETLSIPREVLPEEVSTLPHAYEGNHFLLKFSDGAYLWKIWREYGIGQSWREFQMNFLSLNQDVENPDFLFAGIIYRVPVTNSLMQRALTSVKSMEMSILAFQTDIASLTLERNEARAHIASLVRTNKELADGLTTALQTQRTLEDTIREERERVDGRNVRSATMFKYLVVAILLFVLALCVLLAKWAHFRRRLGHSDRTIRNYASQLNKTLERVRRRDIELRAYRKQEVALRTQIEGLTDRFVTEDVKLPKAIEWLARQNKELGLMQSELELARKGHIQILLAPQFRDASEMGREALWLPAVEEGVVLMPCSAERGRIVHTNVVAHGSGRGTKAHLAKCAMCQKALKIKPAPSMPHLKVG